MAETTASHYGWFAKDSGVFCRYCGEPADTIDHIRPRAWTGEDIRPFVAMVPACRQCNSILGDTLEDSIMARREIIRESLRRRYRHLLMMTPFTDEELDEFGPWLQTNIRADMAKRQLLLARLRWPTYEPT